MVKIKKLRLLDGAIFLFCIGLHFLNHYFNDNVSIPFLSYLFKCYVNDFLGGMAFLAYVNLILSYYKKEPRRIGSISQVLLLACLCSFFWEVITPLFKTSTADWWDFVAYTLGALSYWFIDKAICHNSKIDKIN